MPVISSLLTIMNPMLIEKGSMLVEQTDTLSRLPKGHRVFGGVIEPVADPMGLQVCLVEHASHTAF